MTLEMWILLTVVVAGLAAGIGLRLRHRHRRTPVEVKNLYPLW